MGRCQKLFFIAAVVFMPLSAASQEMGGYGVSAQAGGGGGSPNGSIYGQGYVPLYGPGPNYNQNQPYGNRATVAAAGDRNDYPDNGGASAYPRPRGPAPYPDGLTDPAAGLPPGATIAATIPAPTPSFSTTGSAPLATAASSVTPITANVIDGRIVESKWYVGTEYFHWNERVGGTDFVNESGAFYTLGYEHQLGIERFRMELFGGDIHYSGYTEGGGTPPDALSSNTGYLGLSGQYELVLSPPTWEHAAFLAGVGTRFWIRDLHDGTSVSGYQVYGYDETWWSLYPFLGLEMSNPTGGGWEMFSDVRCGPTCLTYQNVSINTRPLWPKCGVYAAGEAGLRTKHFFLSGYAEFMNWAESSVVEGSFQPASTMYGLGAHTGVTF